MSRIRLEVQQGSTTYQEYLVLFSCEGWPRLQERTEYHCLQLSQKIRFLRQMVGLELGTAEDQGQESSLPEHSLFLVEGCLAVSNDLDFGIQEALL